jgi:hypothetical protein
LDGSRPSWNVAGIEVPAATSPAVEGLAQCQSLVRPGETAEDAAVTAQGWRLASAYQRGWGITLVGGFLNFDAMCRPVPFQWFVFVDDVFAGTLSPQPMYPRTDGALNDAGIRGADSLYAVYDRYGPTDALCCPSGETVVTFAVERTADGPVVTPDVTMSEETVAGVTAPTASPRSTSAVCAGLGGDALTLVFWTDEEIAAQEARTGPMTRAHPVTGTCVDLAGLPVGRERAPVLGFAWLCSRTFDNDWFGPHWVADLYRSESDVPPDPAIGGCPLPRDESFPQPPESEQVAATAVHLSQLEAAGDLDTLYAWLHPDAQAVIPKEAVSGWYAAEWLPREPQPIDVISVDFVEWTWNVTGTPYANVAEVAYEQPLGDGSTVRDVVRLVQDGQGVWRWFFGRDKAFVEDQIARFASDEGGG